MESLDGFRADLLLADVVMPGLDCIELARRAAKLQPGLKVMFITGFAAVALKNRDQTPQGARILSKPFHLRHLVEEVDSMLSLCAAAAGPARLREGLKKTTGGDRKSAV